MLCTRRYACGYSLALRNGILLFPAHSRECFPISPARDSGRRDRWPCSTLGRGGTHPHLILKDRHRRLRVCGIADRVPTRLPAARPQRSARGAYLLRSQPGSSSLFHSPSPPQCCTRNTPEPFIDKRLFLLRTCDRYCSEHLYPLGERTFPTILPPRNRP